MTSDSKGTPGGPEASADEATTAETKGGAPQLLVSWGHPDASAAAAGTPTAAAESCRVIGEAVAQVLPETCQIEGCSLAFHLQLHAKYLLTLGSDPFSLESFFAFSLKMGGAYWASSALWILGLSSKKNKRLLADAARKGRHLPSASGSPLIPESTSNEGDSSISSSNHTVNNDGSECKAISLEFLLESREDALCAWVLRCMRPCGGFAQDVNQDAHITSTHYALLLLVGLGRLHLLPSPEKTAEWLRSLQNPDGGFRGDEWGEADSRFLYCGVASLALLKELDGEVAAKAVGFVRQLMNHDGGFAWVPGGESHAASAFCCLATLCICEGLWAVDRRSTARWLAERQTAGGGFNGRPEKAPDVCYSFWIFSSLQILGYGGWVDKPGLCHFILESQDTDAGGIADRPGDVADPFHTFFGIAALGMLKATNQVEDLHPVLALPVSVVNQLQFPSCILC